MDYPACSGPWVPSPTPHKPDIVAHACHPSTCLSPPAHACHPQNLESGDQEFKVIVFCFVLFCCRQSLACLELYIEQASLELRSIYFCLANAGLKTYTTTLHYCIVFIFKQLENPKFDTYSTLNVLSSMGFTFFS